MTKRERLHIPGPPHVLTNTQFIELYHVVTGQDPNRAKRKIKPHEVQLVLNYAYITLDRLCRVQSLLNMELRD